MRALRTGGLLILGILLLASCSQTTPKDAPSSELAPEQRAVSFFGEEATRAFEMKRIEEGLHDANTSDDSFLRMVKDLGGYDEYFEMLDTLGTEALEALHAKYGIGFSTTWPGTDQTDE